MKVCTIGFTKTSAEKFFQRIPKAGVKRVLDVGLNSVSQLAGFAKKEDLRYFLKAICSVETMSTDPSWHQPGKCWMLTRKLVKTGVRTRGASSN
jgi:hypothetical protein